MELDHIARPPTLFDFAPRAIEQNIIRRICDLHCGGLMSFLMPKPHHPGQFHCIGTGFYVVWPEDSGVVRIATAAHVLDEFDFVAGRVTVGELRIALGDVGQRNRHAYLDTVVWAIPTGCFVRRGVTSINGFPLCSPEDGNARFIPTDSFLIMGYPASKNKALDFRGGKEPGRHILAMGLHTCHISSEPGILRLHYTGKVIAEAWARDRANALHLQGMSGSPCLRIVIDRKTKQMGVVLAGVFTEWQKTAQTLSMAWFGDPWLPPPGVDAPCL